jgi:acetylornithine deacetylase/succinyl-diaminopimelate desuccinylase-like protein
MSSSYAVSMNPTPKLAPEHVFATLGDLVSINSVNPHYPGGPGEGVLAEYVGEFFTRNSIPFTYQAVFDGRPNVVATLAGASDRKLIFEAHMDTASELGMSIEPFCPTRKGNLMYGRGSCDTKAGLAAMMHAFRAVNDSGIQPGASAVLVAAVDEEHAFRGIVKYLETALTAEGAVVAEPTSLESVVASKGVLRWRGINAITKMSRFIIAAEENLSPKYRAHQHPLLGSPTLTVGTIHGGIQVNQVPESCAVEIDRRLLPGETQRTVWNELNMLISELQAEDPELKLEMEQPMLEDSAMETPVSTRIVQIARNVSQKVRGTSRVVGVPYGSDASKLARAGIPSIILGPGSIDRAHAAEEYVELDEVALAAEIYTRILLEF